MRGSAQYQRDLFLLVPDVVAACQQMNALIEQILGNLDGQAEAAGGILAVGNDDIDRVPVHQTIQLARQRLAARFADDIAYK